MNRDTFLIIFFLAGAVSAFVVKYEIGFWGCLIIANIYIANKK